MLYLLKESEVSSVSQKIGQSICDKTFQNYTKIDGEQLISLTNSRQVNSFIIRSLFNQWRKEIEKLESPYFDFKHEKVQEALKGFMNVLSNHISIDRPHLEPILDQAIADSIRIAFLPHSYLESVLDRIQKPQDFKLQIKYIKTNRDVFKNLVEKIGDFDTRPSILQTFEQYSEADFELVDAEEFCRKLGAEELLETLFEKKDAIVETKVEAVKHPEPLADPSIEQVLVKDGKSFSTLNDKFETGAKGQTLAEKLQKKVNKSIEASLTLNEKFMFQNNLFNGENAKMREAFAMIDLADDLQDALNRANQFNNDWDMDSEEVEAFMNVLERKFS